MFDAIERQPGILCTVWQVRNKTAFWYTLTPTRQCGGISGYVMACFIIMCMLCIYWMDRKCVFFNDVMIYMKENSSDQHKTTVSVTHIPAQQTPKKHLYCLMSKRSYNGLLKMKSHDELYKYHSGSDRVVKFIIN